MQLFAKRQTARGPVIIAQEQTTDDGPTAAATAASALTLTAEAAGASKETQQRLERFEIIAGGAELAATAGLHREWKRQQLDGPLHEQPVSTAYKLGAIGLGIAVPLAIPRPEFSGTMSSRPAISCTASSNETQAGRLNEISGRRACSLAGASAICGTAIRTMVHTLLSNGPVLRAASRVGTIGRPFRFRRMRLQSRPLSQG